MGPGDSDRCKEKTCRELSRRPGRGGLRPEATRSLHGFPGSDLTAADGQAEAPEVKRRLEELRRRLLRAFLRAVSRRGCRRSRAVAAAAAREEQSRARVEDALAGLRADLLEMHFQSRQLARTLLDLNMKMQQLKKACDLKIASKSQSLDDNAVKLENGNVHWKI